MIDEKLMLRNAKLYRQPVYERTAKTVAYHEAGHYVVQKVIGLIPTKTSVDKKKLNGVAKCDAVPTKCTIEFEDMPIEIQRMGACRYAAMYQAGGIAERIYTNTSVDGVVMSYGTDDKASRKILGFAGLSSLCQYPDLLAKEILHNNWEMVEEVAKKLLDKGTINWALQAPVTN